MELIADPERPWSAEQWAAFFRDALDKAREDGIEITPRSYCSGHGDCCGYEDSLSLFLTGPDSEAEVEVRNGV